MSIHQSTAYTADEALERLQAGNERFVRGEARFSTVQKEILAELAKGLARLVRSGAKDESALPFERVSGKAAAGKWRNPFIIAAAAIAVAGASAIAAWMLWPAPRWT